MSAPGHPERRLRTGPSLGLSIVELMIGVVIGMFILAAASLVMTTQLGDNRRLLLDTQVQQDLRAVAALINRDIRRANYWGKSQSQVWADTLVPATANPYKTMVPQTTASSDHLQYARSLDDEFFEVGREDNVVSASELVTFKLNSTTNAIEMQLGAATAQALTDTDVLKVTTFDFVLTETLQPLPCGVDCPVLGVLGCPLVQSVREVTFVIVAEARYDARIKRSISDTVRLRNDLNRELSPCP